MKRVLLFCLLLSGCASINDLPRSISYIYINMPNTQGWKLIEEEDEKWMEGLINNCAWVKSGDVKASKYLFEITGKNQTYLGQLSGNLIYMASGNVIYKCQLDNNSANRLVSLYES